MKRLCKANTQHQFVEAYINKNGKNDYRPKPFVRKTVKAMLAEAMMTLTRVSPCFIEFNFHWVEVECPLKVMNALNLFFRRGWLFDEPFPPLYDLPISNDTIYTKVKAPDREREGSVQEKTVKNESNNIGSSREQGGMNVNRNFTIPVYN
jgi:hypothetical protein